MMKQNRVESGNIRKIIVDQRL